MKYIVYITINLCNGKFYIGVHKTNPEVFDGYIGCGIYRQSNATKNFPLHKAVKKYGYSNFRRTTIKIFETPEPAYELEKVLVNETLLRSKNSYNIALGGSGGNNIDNNKRVYLFSLNGEYLRTFINVREAASFISDKDIDTTIKAIRNNCLGISKSSFNYYWSYTKVFNYKSSKVAQYTLNGKFLMYYNSITEAQEKLQLNTIEQAIRKNYSAGGYQWRKYNGDNSDIPSLINIKTQNTLLPIVMFDSQMNFIEEFNSVKECVKAHPELSTSQINKVLKGINKTHKGYIFKYKDEDIVCFK